MDNNKMKPSLVIGSIVLQVAKLHVFRDCVAYYISKYVMQRVARSENSCICSEEQARSITTSRE